MVAYFYYITTGIESSQLKTVAYLYVQKPTEGVALCLWNCHPRTTRMSAFVIGPFRDRDHSSFMNVRAGPAENACVKLSRKPRQSGTAKREVALHRRRWPYPRIWRINLKLTYARRLPVWLISRKILIQTLPQYVSISNRAYQTSMFAEGAYNSRSSAASERRQPVSCRT